MLLTPEEAKKERCPQTFTADTTATGRPLVRGAYCIGPACKMAWRWRRTLIKGIEHIEFEKKRGYCGLAGKP